MNLAYYVVLFDLATDVLFDQIEVGATYRRAAAAGLFAVETHTDIGGSWWPGTASGSPPG